MFNTRHYLYLILVFLTQLTFAQEKKSTQSNSFPFTLTGYNNISLKAILNGKDTVQLMFHTAANGITLTEEATQKLKSLQFNGKTEGIKSWGGQENSSRLSKGNTIQIGKSIWSNISIDENKNSGQNTDGKFGIDFFKDQIIEIDFDNNLLTLYPTLPEKAKAYEKLKLSIQNDMLFLEGNCQIAGQDFKNKFLIHSGYSGAILFDDQFTADQKLGEKLKITGENQLKDSFGNVLKTKKAILPALKIGNIELTEVPVGFFEGAIGRQKMSIIGGDVLKRMNMIIDSKKADVYLKLSHLQKTQYSVI